MHMDAREQRKPRQNGRFGLGIIRTFFSRFSQYSISIKPIIRTIIELIGFGLLVFGAYLIWIPAACFVAGIAVIFLAQGLGGDNR